MRTLLLILIRNTIKQRRRAWDFKENRAVENNFFVFSFDILFDKERSLR